MDDSITAEIALCMDLLIHWAKAYEEGVAEVDDSVYDAQVRQLARYEKAYPEDWKEALVCCPEFKDGSWKYTGSFYHLN